MNKRRCVCSTYGDCGARHGGAHGQEKQVPQIPPWLALGKHGRKACTLYCGAVRNSALQRASACRASFFERADQPVLGGAEDRTAPERQGGNHLHAAHADGRSDSVPRHRRVSGLHGLRAGVPGHAVPDP